MARLFEVAIASLSRREARLGQVLPVEGTPGQLLVPREGPCSVEGQAVDMARERGAPGRQPPGHMLLDGHRPAERCIVS